MNRELYDGLRRLLDGVTRRLAESPGADATEALARLAQQNLDISTFRELEPRQLKALRHLAPCVAETMLLCPFLAARIAAVEDHLRWLQTPSYTDELLGAGFVDNYGWCELVGPNGFFPGDDFLLGFLLMGPHLDYRDHYHPAPELYWPLTGDTEWRQGNGDYHKPAAGTVIWHSPMERHATRTGERPLLALWMWTRDTKTPTRLAD
jgi:hypothetical protein